MTDPKDCLEEPNNFCEPDQNNEICDWDQGDCCGPTVMCLHPPCDPCHFTKFSLKSLYDLGCKDYLYGLEYRFGSHEGFLQAYPTIAHMKNVTLEEAVGETGPRKDDNYYKTFINNYNWVQFFCDPFLNTKQCNYDEGRCCHPITFTQIIDDCPGWDSCICHLDHKKHIERTQPHTWAQKTMGIHKHGFELRK